MNETYYVSLNGSDANDGRSESRAFRTVRRGVSELRAGDTLLIRAGDYGDEQAEAQASGTEESPITIRAEDPGRVILRGTGGGSGISLTSKSYVVVEGIEFTGYSHGVSIRYASTHNTVRRCVFLNNNSSGILLYGNIKSPTDSHHHIFTENQFLDYAETGLGSPTSKEGIQDYGLCLYFSTDIDAVNNYFYGHHHQCLSFKKIVSNSRAANNVFEGFYYSAIYLGQNDDSTEEGNLRSYNLLAEGNTFRPADRYHAKRPIAVANVSDAVVRNNFIDSVYGGGGGAGVEIDANATGAKVYGNVIVNARGKPAIYAGADCEIYNNTVVGCDVGLAVVTGANPIVKNNIFSRNGEQVRVLPPRAFRGDEEHSSRFLPDGGVWTWRPDHTRKPVYGHNNWFPDWEGKGVGDISSDPRFVGPFAELKAGPRSPKFVPDGERAMPYRLAGASPCVGRGVDVGLPFAGTAPDLGAFGVSG